jgi:hypothetical protein
MTAVISHLEAQVSILQNNADVMEPKEGECTEKWEEALIEIHEFEKAIDGLKLLVDAEAFLRGWGHVPNSNP